MGTDHDAVLEAASFFTELLAECVDPLTVEVDGHTWDIPAPAGDEVAALDVCVDADEVLDELLGDLADDILDVLDDLPWSHTRRLARQVRAHFALDDPPPGGWAELVRRLDTYGGAIEADLPHEWPGVELEQWMRGERPWAQLYRLLDSLPPGSRYVAALRADPDLAQAQIDADAERDDDEAAERDRDRPPLWGETYERSLLRAAVSALLRIEHATYAVHAGKGKSGKPPNPLPGPLSARTVLMREHGMDDVADIFAAIEGRDMSEVGRDDLPGFTTTDSGLIVPD